MTYKSAKLHILQAKVKALEKLLSKGDIEPLMETYKKQLDDAKITLYNFAKWGR